MVSSNYWRGIFMNNNLKFRDILYNEAQLGPYPLEKLKRVNEPTTKYVGEIKRRDQREHALALSGRGDYGEAVKKRAPLFTVNEPIGAAFVDIQTHINSIKRNPPAPHKAPIPDDPRVLSRHIKSLGYFLGADMMGICKLPKSAVYTHDMSGKPIDADFKYAVVFLCVKDLKTVNASNGYDWIFDPVSFQAYQRLACQTETAANYIRRLGFEAEASNMDRYLTLMPQLILEAGLGEVSRLGIVLNPFVGANFKAAAVLTNLPLEADLPVDFGLQEYCSSCRICAEQCPTRSISFGEKVIYNGYETWKMNERTCASFAMLNKKGNMCGRCAKVCPWNRPDVSPDHYKNWDGDMLKIIDEVNQQAKRMKEQNYVHESENTHKWWLDLELINGRLEIPSSSKQA
jgi:ferredoxin